MLHGGAAVSTLTTQWEGLSGWDRSVWSWHVLFMHVWVLSGLQLPPTDAASVHWFMSSRGVAAQGTNIQNTLKVTGRHG